MTFTKGRIVKILSHQITVEGLHGVQIGDVILSNDKTVLGEAVKVQGDSITVALICTNEALCIGDEVRSTNAPSTVEVGPGIMEGIFDHLQRPLNLLAKRGSIHIKNSSAISGLNHNKKWEFTAQKQANDTVKSGEVLGTVVENEVFLHKILVPNGINGRVTKIYSGEFNIEDIIATIEDKNGKSHFVTMLKRIPIKTQKPKNEELFALNMPLQTSIRAIDSFYPIGKGEANAIIGKSKSGKSILLRQIAKHSESDVLIFISSGATSLEISETANELLRYTDPKTGRSHLKRSIFFCASTKMPLAQRNALYQGVAVAEYFRQMGYSVLLIVDSLSDFTTYSSLFYQSLKASSDCVKLAQSDLQSDCIGRVGALKTDDEKASGSITLIGSGDESLTQFASLDTSIRLKTDPLLRYPKLDFENSITVPEKLCKDAQIVLKALKKGEQIKALRHYAGSEALTQELESEEKLAKLIGEVFIHQDTFNRLDKEISKHNRGALLQAIAKLCQYKNNDPIFEKILQMFKELKQTQDVTLDGIISILDSNIKA